MDRLIVFRGYQEEQKKWYYGDLIHVNNGGIFIFSYQNNFENRVVVNPSTVGQYTGFDDAGKVRLFEGDNIENDGNVYTIYWCSHTGIWDCIDIFGNNIALSELCPSNETWLQSNIYKK